VRLVAATNKDLENEIRNGRFREDLYYRINVVSVDIPPLRDREDDVLFLAQHFIEQIAARSGRAGPALSAAAVDVLLSYSWPGNVRELANCIERAVALAEDEWIEPEHFPPKLQQSTRHAPVPVEGELLPLCEIEQGYIRHVLEQTCYNKTKAAQVLGIDRRTLHRKLRSMPVQDDPPSGRRTLR
jgi:two-component system response regulator HydG